MSFLDKPLSDLSGADLRRLIAHEVARQIPAIPAGVAGLDDLDVPIIPPDGMTNNQVLVFHAPSSSFIAGTVSSTGDGYAPASPSPTPSIVGGVGVLVVSWTKVSLNSNGGTQADAVGYDVHISSASSAFVPSAATLVGTTVATSFVIHTLADGLSPLVYNTPYYVKLVAFDVDGSASASSSGLDPNTLAAPKISADLGTMTAGTLIGTTVETAASGQRVVMDPDGLHLYDSSTPAALVVDLPTDSTKPSYFAGAADITGATLRGAANAVAQGASLVLSGGVSQPLTLAALAKDATVGSLTPAQTYYLEYAWAKASTGAAATITNATPAVVTATCPDASGWLAKDPVIFTTTGGLPTGLTAGTVYYIKTVVTSTTFQVAATRGGAAINTSSAGSGVHTVTRYKETQPSPVASINVGTGTSLRYTIPACPTGADTAFVYVSTATFGSGGGHYQTKVTVSTSATTTTVLSAYASGGSVSATANTFQGLVGSGGASSGAVASAGIVSPGFPTDTAGTDYSWRLEGNGRARFVGPTMNVQYWWYSDFLGLLAALPDGMLEITAAGGGTGNGVAKGVSSNINPGVLQVVTGTGTTGRDTVRLDQTAIVTGVARIRVTAYAASGGVPTAGQAYQAIIGLFDNTLASAVASGTNNAIAFGFGSTSTATLGLWVTKNGTGTFTQAVDSAGNGVSWASGVYHLLDFEVNPAGTSIAWWVDGVPQTAVTTNIPTAGMGLTVSIEKTAGATSRAFNVDALSIYGDFVS